MSEQNMKNVRRLFEEVWTQGNLALLPEVMAHDSLCYPMPQLDAVRGCDEYMAFIAVYKETFLDMSFKIEDQFATEGKVATRWVTHVMAASEDVEQPSINGEHLSIDGITITHHNSEGKIVAEWTTWDTEGLLQSAEAPRIFEQLSIGV